MRITTIAPGSRGDVQPYIALGLGLVAAGHRVRVLTHRDFESLVGLHGLEYWPLEARAADIAQSAQMRQRMERGKFLAVLSQMGKDARRGAVHLAESALAASRDADLLLSGLAGLFASLAVAEKLDLPIVQAHYIPFSPTREFPSFVAPYAPAGLCRSLNRLSYALAQQMVWQAYRPADRIARRDVLDLPPAPPRGPHVSSLALRYPILYGYSPSVIPRPADWGDLIHVTGYWFLGPSEHWTPPPPLVSFLQAGPPPVFVGFGSMSSRSPEATTGLILEALERAGQRAVVLSGWGAMSPTSLPQCVLMVESVPYSWLFPRVAAVVHHGGAGTTAEGLRAGVPSVIVPFFGDQPYWGRRIADLGVGPQPIRRRRLTAEALAAAICRAVTDQQMRRRAAALGERIRSEDGVARAVEVIEGVATHKL
jgi:UDP:flavonoid glycosyltransferase YjiC (YdhE family)